MLYLIIFIISVFFVFLATKVKNNKIYTVIFLSLAVFFPCLLASLRDLTIGTDIKVYVEPLFSWSFKYNNFISFVNNVYNVKDYAYIFVTYISGRLSPNISYLFFFNQALIMIPVLVALIKKIGLNKEMIYGWILFLLVMYNQSFNMVRQSIAISFSILALSYIDDKKIIKFLIFSLIAYLFHKSAIILFPLLLLYKLLNSTKISNKNKYFIKLVIFVLLVCLIIFLPQLLYIFKEIGFISPLKYNIYATKYIRSGLDFPVVRTLIYISTYIFICYNKKFDEISYNEYKIIKYYTILSIVLLQYCSRIAFAERISYYLFYPIVILYIPLLLKNVKNKIFNIIFFIGVFAFYWIYWVLILNYDSTYPYIFR